MDDEHVLAYAERELAKLMASKGEDARFNRARRKLLDDLRLAENDVSVLANMLALEVGRA
jgi:hypothetical protein